MTSSIETTEADAQPWAMAAPTTTTANHDPFSHLRGQILVLATLLRKTLDVVRNVEAEGGDEAELLQHLITQGDAAVTAVLQEHALRQTGATA